MSRKLIVEVVLDAAAYARQVQKAQTQTTQLAKTIENSGRQTAVATAGFKGLGKSVALATGGFVAFGGLTDVLRTSINAAREAGITQQQLATQLNVVGINAGAAKGQIDEATNALSNLSGFQTGDLEQSLTQLVRTTGNLSVALRLNRVAADVARGRHISLASAANILARAYNGQTGSLRRLGIEIPKTMKGMEAINLVSAEFAGQAEAGATSVDKFSSSLNKLQVEIGKGLQPGFDFLLSSFTGLVSGIEAVNSRLRGMHLGFLTRGAGPSIFGLFGGDKKPAAARPFPDVGFRTADIGPPPGYETKKAEQRNKWFDAMIGRRELRASLLTGASAQLAAYKAIGATLTAQIAAVHDVTRKWTLKDEALKNAATVAGLEASIAADLKQKQQDAAQKLKDQIDAARQEKMGWLDFAIERAQATKTIKDNLAADRAKEKWLQGLIKKEGRTLELVSDLWRVRQDIKNLNKKNADGKDPLAGLFQVSSSQLANILAAGTGLGAAGRRRLGFNIAGAEIQPVHVHLNLDGREVASVVTKQQKRSSNRTGAQTSGRRG